MRTFGFLLLAVAAISLAFTFTRTVIPFRLPMTGDDGLHAALVFFLAGALAVVGSRFV